MVLEEASLLSDSFSDIDNNPASESRPKDWRYGYSYPIAQFAQPAPLSGFTSAYARARIDFHLALLSQLAQRRLTDQEANTSARIYANGLAVNSYAVLLGWAGGAFQVYRKMNMLTLPFLDLEKRGYSFERFGPFRGQISRLAWQGVRVGVYGQCWAVITGLAGAIWAHRYVEMRLQVDPDLKDLYNLIKKRSLADRNADTTKVRKTIPDHLPSELRRRSNQSRAPNTAVEEDTYSSSSDEPEVSSDAERHRYEREMDANAKRSRTGTISSRTAPVSDRSETSYYDETSPTGGKGPFDYGTSSENKTASGSAWDRVRQQASNGEPDRATSSRSQSPRVWQQQQNSSEDENNSGFSDKNEDSQVSRAKAQEEFDAQLERERKGSADNESSYKRW